MARLKEKAFINAILVDRVGGGKYWHVPYTARTEDMPRKPFDPVVRVGEFR